MKRSPSGIPPRAGPGPPCGPWSRSRWMWRTGCCSPARHDDKERLVAEASRPYDIVVLGGGSGGYACALRAAELGMRVALIERDRVGGTCLHRGCIPTKALLHAAEIADHANEAESFGVRARLGGIDMPGVNADKAKVVDRLGKGLQDTPL